MIHTYAYKLVRQTPLPLVLEARSASDGVFETRRVRSLLPAAKRLPSGENPTDLTGCEPLAKIVGTNLEKTQPHRTETKETRQWLEERRERVCRCGLVLGESSRHVGLGSSKANSKEER